MPWHNARQPIPTSNANEANCDVNCFDESSTQNSGGGHSGWRSGKTLTVTLAVLLTMLSCPSPTWGEGWDALFSDYLLTGQEPRPAVARVVAPDGSGTSLGSGVLVDVNASQALVLTNWHVVRDSRSAVLVQFPDGFQSAGTILRVDSVWDLAAIVIWKPNVEPVQLAPRAPVVGETLTIAGYGRGPYREVSGGCTQYLSPGSGQPLELVELVGEARQGDSGGPIFNSSGELAGILFGESGGRTVGASSPRVRAFLASVGSSGYAAAAPTSLASNIDEPAPPSVSLMTASHRPAVPEEQGPSRLPTLAVASATPPKPMLPEGPAQPPTNTLTSEEPVAPGPAGAAPAEPPPLAMDDLVNAVRSCFPSGNPRNLAAVIGGGTLILFGLRGISRVMA
jgi:hypothetical protein